MDVVLNKKELVNFTKYKENEDIIRLGYNVFKVDDLFYKFSPYYTHINEYKKDLISIKQIERLISKQENIKNTLLPKGIIYYNGYAIGVYYKYFDNYKQFNYLYKEDIDLIINNLNKAVRNNNELIANDIYNTDFIFQNILYKDNDVQLIDLDGDYIKDSTNCSVLRAYRWFFYNLRNSMCLYLGYNNMTDIEYQINDICSLSGIKDISLDYPLEVVKRLERVIKRY